MFVQGERRSVIIIPEITFNAGWKDIAFKISRFINENKTSFITNAPRVSDPNSPLAASVRTSKWQTRESNAVLIKTSNNRIFLSGGDAMAENGLLGRCVVGNFKEDLDEKPTLADIRRWSVSTWKNSFGVNIYEMGGCHFLFEFPTKYMAEQILIGEWRWKRAKFHLDWWSPVAGCCSDNQQKKEIWIRAMGLPLHFWTEKVFKAIGDKCGGWLETEEETKLKNHLKWARIKVKGNGADVPKEVTIVENGLIFIIPIWCESPTRVLPGGEEDTGRTCPALL